MPYRLFVLSLLFVGGVIASSFAKDVYVAQSGSGSQSGTDGSSAYALAWLNSPANWNNINNAAAVLPGDTVHLVGRFTSVLTLQGSGTAGNPITLYFEPGANFTAPCWHKDSGAIDPNNKSYIVIDGGVNGIIQNTACGTAFTNRASSAINGNLSHAIIQNLTVTNLYLRTSYTDFLLWFEGANCIRLSGNDLTVSNCALSDASALVTLQPGAGAVNTNYIVINNHLLKANHFCSFSVPEHTTVSNVVLSGNLFDHADVWDGGGGANNLHMDYIIFQDGASGGIIYTNAYFSGIFINGNTFGANYTANLTGIAGAAHGQTAILAEYLNSDASEFRNAFVFNNLVLTHTNETWGNAPLTLSGSNVWLVNNTCIALEGNAVSCGGALGISGAYAYAYNNICFPGYGVNLTGITTNVVSGANSSANDRLILTSYLATIWSDYNIAPMDANGYSRFGYGVNHSIAGGTPFNGLSLTTLTGWQTYYGNVWHWPLPIWNTSHADPHSITTIPAFSPGTYIPVPNDTAARGRGTNLTTIANDFGVPALLTDMGGNPRPGAGPWTIGALEIPWNGPIITLTASPENTNLGTPATLTWTTVNSTSLVISGIGTVALNGSINLPSNQPSITYTAIAVGPNGTNSVTIKTKPAPPSSLSTSPGPSN